MVKLQDTGSGCFEYLIQNLNCEIMLLYGVNEIRYTLNAALIGLANAIFQTFRLSLLLIKIRRLRATGTIISFTDSLSTTKSSLLSSTLSENYAIFVNQRPPATFLNLLAKIKSLSQIHLSPPLMKLTKQRDILTSEAATDRGRFF